MWPVNAQPRIRERQMYLQSLQGKELVFLRKPGSKALFTAYMGLFSVALVGNLYGLIQYARGKATKAE